MKALSIRQPWAWLVVHGIKSVENRSWPTQYRGRFLVHASQKFDLPKKEYETFRDEIQQDFEVVMPATSSDFETSGIVGAVSVIDCVTECADEYDQQWHEPGYYAFLLDDPEIFPFRPMKGKLHFFEVPDVD